MLQAAIVVAQGKPERLKGFRDPYGDGPFSYRRVERGFELRSKLTLEGAPVTLRVGAP
jgi:hypothetical protein